MKKNNIISLTFLDLKKYFKEHKTEVVVLWILLLLFVFLVAIYTFYKVDHNPNILNDVWNSSGKRMNTIVHGSIFGDILFSNMLLSVVIICISLIPIPYLYCFPTIISLISLGQLVGILDYEHGTIKTIKYLITLILPHGIFEITAIVFTLIIAKSINKYSRQIITLLLNHDILLLKKIPCFIKKEFIYFLIIVFPLLISAAFIEAFIVPVLFKIFL